MSIRRLFAVYVLICAALWIIFQWRVAVFAAVILPIIGTAVAMVVRVFRGIFVDAQFSLLEGLASIFAVSGTLALFTSMLNPEDRTIEWIALFAFFAVMLIFGTTAYALSQIKKASITEPAARMQMLVANWIGALLPLACVIYATSRPWGS